MEMSGIAFVVSTLVVGVVVLEMGRRRQVRGLSVASSDMPNVTYLDPVTRADVLVARGHHHEARRLLEEILREAPEREEIRERLRRLDA